MRFSHAYSKFSGGAKITGGMPNSLWYITRGCQILGDAKFPVAPDLRKCILFSQTRSHLIIITVLPGKRSPPVFGLASASAHVPG